jgi:CubicO group peptidase (beta-lactamase class C family)
MKELKIATLLETIGTTSFQGLVHLESGPVTYLHVESGLSDLPGNKPVKDNTAFAVASGTKFLTALAVLKLVAEGRISLETHVESIVPDIKGLYDPGITIRHLLSHTSGMPDYFDEDSDEGTGLPNDRLEKPSDFVTLFPKEPMRHAPGERFIYNNQGFVILALMIEALTGEAYSTIINEYLLKPLGITQSGIFHLEHLPAHAAKGYVNTDHGMVENIGKVPVMSGGDGGAYMTLDDMKRLYEAFFKGDIVPMELVTEAIRVQTLTSDEGTSAYGLGIWLEREKNDGPWIPTLYGGDPGISFTSSYDPVSKTFGYAVSNTSDDVWTIHQAYKEALWNIIGQP